MKKQLWGCISSSLVVSSTSTRVESAIEIWSPKIFCLTTIRPWKSLTLAWVTCTHLGVQKSWRLPVGHHAMLHLRWLLERGTLDWSLMSGAVVLCSMQWSVASCHLKTPKLLICTKRSWLVTISFQSSCLKTVLISYLKFLTLIQKRDMALMKSEAILGLSSKKIDCLMDYSQELNQCQWMTKCIKWCWMNSTTILTIQWNALRPIGTIRSLQRTIFSQKRHLDKTRISSAHQTVAVLSIWLALSTEVKSLQDFNSKNKLKDKLILTLALKLNRHIREVRVQQSHQEFVVAKTL